ncbi:MAG: cofactor-independent phosphoglycerate mutase [Deltaproteobacteria bacterium]|nr:cofactor-independent phosphoglycerate mutase [Deltaproteobacteria bacterium]
MKYALLIGAGLGDHPLAELGGHTPLEAASTPTLDALAAGGYLGLARTIPDSLEPGSDLAAMSLMGYDPVKYPTGRGALEAAAMGVNLGSEDSAFRMNLVTLAFEEGRMMMRDHSGGNITSADAKVLIEYLARELPLTRGQRLYPGVGYRHLLVWTGHYDDLPTIPPHDWRDQEVTDYLTAYKPGMKPIQDLIQASWPLLADHPYNREQIAKGKRPANSIWPWGQGRPSTMPTYQERWGLSGAVISAVDMIKGLGMSVGLKPIFVHGATGLVDTNYEGKVAAALQAIKTGDVVMVHFKAPDEASHQGDIAIKVETIERFDQRIVKPIWEALETMGDYRLLIACDHYTPISLKTHSREPIPFIIYPGSHRTGRTYSEKQAADAGLYFPQGHLLADLFFGN